MLLSICIPTHHGRAATLERTLESIRPGVTASDDVEVCISDNASHDGTAALVARFGLQMGEDRLRYHRNEENLGFTRNMLTVVELARGRFCWFVGSDDVVYDGGVGEVRALIARHPQVAGVTLNRTHFNPRLSTHPHHDPPSLLPARPAEEQEFLSLDEIFKNVGQLHDFLSTQIVDRACWEQAVKEAGQDVFERGRSYPHMWLFALMIRSRPRWAWYPKPLVEQRTGTAFFNEDDSDYDFADWELRILRDRAAIWADLFGERSRHYRQLLARVYRRHFVGGALLHFKLQPSYRPASNRRVIFALPRYYWWLPRFWLEGLPILFLPSRPLQALRPILRSMKQRLPISGQPAG